MASDGENYNTLDEWPVSVMIAVLYMSVSCCTCAPIVYSRLTCLVHAESFKLNANPAITRKWVRASAEFVSASC